MKLSQYVADFIAAHGSRVYGICGAGAMHLNDAICNHPGIRFIAMHHEQAAAMAAEAESRVTGKCGFVHVTAGPGGTNTITGVAGAWVDSIPMMVIAGQVNSATLIGHTGLRQLGTNELDLVSMVTGITKYAVTVRDPRDIRFCMEKAFHLATSGRQGPVWIEIPLDVQAAEVDPFVLPGYHGSKAISHGNGAYIQQQVARTLEMLNEAERPVILAGNGVRLAGAAAEFGVLADTLGVPILSSWTASDLIPTDHPYYIGRPGIMGDRPGNFAIQNADLLLAIGTRLSVPQTGHSPHLFAPRARKIVVDIDPRETAKPTIDVDLPIVVDAGEFIRALLATQPNLPRRGEWIGRCRGWKARYPVMRPEYRETKDGINSYYFMGILSKHLDDDAIVVTDVGAGFISAMQSLPLRDAQRLFHSGGVSAMGWSIPAAIGACLAGGGRQVVCLVGDGGAMLNLQELQTIAHHKLPISIFVFCNNGYMTMQFTQQNHFGREAASSPGSGVSCADFTKIASAMLPMGAAWILRPSPYLLNVGEVVQGVLDTARKTPALCEVHMPPNQLLIPRVQSRMENGKFIPTPIEDMWPYLDRDEFAEQMGATEAVS